MSAAPLLDAKDASRASECTLPAVPMPEGVDGEAFKDLAEFLEERYEVAMVKDLTGVITRNQREKWRAGNQVRAEVGRVRARATSRELQALQRTRTSVDALTTDQLTAMRARISDEVELYIEAEARESGPEYLRRRRARQYVQLVADAVVPGGVSTGLASDKGETPVVDAKGRELVGSATLQVCVPDAPLPPPFPSSRPYRCYLANMVGSRAFTSPAADARPA